MNRPIPAFRAIQMNSFPVGPSVPLPVNMRRAGVYEREGLDPRALRGLIRYSDHSFRGAATHPGKREKSDRDPHGRQRGTHGDHVRNWACRK